MLWNYIYETGAEYISVLCTRSFVAFEAAELVETVYNNEVAMHPFHN